MDHYIFSPPSIIANAFRIMEIQITTEAVAAAATPGESSSLEEPSLWREYEGRENARDRGVLTRSNRCVRLEPIPGPAAVGTVGGRAHLAYALNAEVQFLYADSVWWRDLGGRIVIAHTVSMTSHRVKRRYNMVSNGVVSCVVVWCGRI